MNIEKATWYFDRLLPHIYNGGQCEVHDTAFKVGSVRSGTVYWELVNRCGFRIHIEHGMISKVFVSDDDDLKLLEAAALDIGYGLELSGTSRIGNTYLPVHIGEPSSPVSPVPYHDDWVRAFSVLFPLMTQGGAFIFAKNHMGVMDVDLDFGNLVLYQDDGMCIDDFRIDCDQHFEYMQMVALGLGFSARLIKRDWPQGGTVVFSRILAGGNE